jgi:hypothetical protein
VLKNLAMEPAYGAASAVMTATLSCSLDINFCLVFVSEIGAVRRSRDQAAA